MADVPVGSVPAPEGPIVTQTRPQSAVVAAREARLAKMKEVSAGIAKMNAAESGGQERAQPSPPTKVEKLPSETLETEKPVENVEAKTDEPKPAEPKQDAKADDPDPQTKKALDAIDKQAKRFRDEQAAAKRAFDQEMAEQRAELARIKAEQQSKYGAVEDLQKLADRDLIGLIRKLRPNMSEDDWEVVGRGAFPFTKAGKADPRAAEIAARTHKETSRDSELSELRKMVTDLTEQVAASKRETEGNAFRERWLGDAVKSFPKEASLAGHLYAKNPTKVRQALLEVGMRMERDNDNETPTHADVIAEYERLCRAELEEIGIDVDALIRPAAAAPQKKPTPTLDPSLPTGGTRPINGKPTREQKLAAVTAGLKKLEAESL